MKNTITNSSFFSLTAKFPPLFFQNENCWHQTTDSNKKPSSEVKSAVTVGDRVVIDDCPGHWASFSPFTVESIDGEMAKLEMVGKRVETKRLSVIDG